MPLMRVTEHEKKFLLAERERIALDNNNWDAEPFITDLQMCKMSQHVVARLLADPKWVPDHCAFVWYNSLHPDNLEWNQRRLAREMLARTPAIADVGFFKGNTP